MSVYLSQVKISYFKSFCGVEKIEITKPGQWISVIGKNGSGKVYLFFKKSKFNNL